MKAFLKNYRQAPRKVRLVADSVRGKQVSVALIELSHMTQKAAPVIKNLIASAVANAGGVDTAVSPEALKVDRITVDKGTTYTRFRPRAFGRAAPINRESSHVRVELAPIEGDRAVAKSASQKSK